MDNIFVSKVNATVLEPELLEHIANKKKWFIIRWYFTSLLSLSIELVYSKALTL